MANTLYKTTVRELEAVLPPRVVSQSLQEGLAAVGKDADTLSYGDAESILQNRVLPRLTLSLGAARAETARREILARLSELPDESELPALDHGAQARALRDLQDALRPFNVYFDWRETQELRAQLAQIGTEHAAERNAGALLTAARAQLGALQQKLDEVLSVQARELVALEAALQENAALKSPKARRLGLLLEFIRSTHAAHKLAPAEVERARKLTDDLKTARLLNGDAQEPPAQAQRAFSGRVAAAASTAATLTPLNPEAAADLRGRVQLLEQLLSAPGGTTEGASLEQRAELEAALEETEAFIATLQKEADTIRSVAAQLIQDDVLGDIFGFFGVPAPEPAISVADLQSWLERQIAHEEIGGLALYVGNDTFVAGDLPTDADALRRTVNDAVHADIPIDTPGTDHERGSTTRSVEMQGRTFVTFRLGHGNSLVLVTHAQGDAARQRLEAALPELVALLE